jgi:hypothetical protein
LSALGLWGAYACFGTSLVVVPFVAGRLGYWLAALTYYYPASALSRRLGFAVGGCLLNFALDGLLMCGLFSLFPPSF